MRKLFSTHTHNGLTLKNRIAMAPMTRSRALNNVPNENIASFYAQRADAGLLITEGTSPSPNGLGYARIPGIYSQEQINGWRKVTSAVHEKGGTIFIQLMHTGRVSHPRNLPTNATILAPSAVALENTQMWVDGEGMKEIPAPQEMTLDQVKHTIKEHIQAALNAIEAGFDGVEIHGANGYLIKQFLNPHTNRRTDEYGGSIENRSRFLLEITEGIANVIGKEKVGVRISPYSTFNETILYTESDQQYLYIVNQLNKLDIAYLHINDPSAKGEAHGLAKEIRKAFKNTLILCGGFDAGKAEAALLNNEADVIAFGVPFIANPDLVSRFKNKLPLNQPKFDLFYAPGVEGYTDYPVFEDVTVVA